MSLQNLLDAVETLKADYAKFQRGNASAGTRARKSLQAIKKHAQEIRCEIQSAKKSEDAA